MTTIYWCRMCSQMVNPIMQLGIECPFCRSEPIEEFESLDSYFTADLSRVYFEAQFMFFRRQNLRRFTEEDDEDSFTEEDDEDSFTDFTEEDDEDSFTEEDDEDSFTDFTEEDDEDNNDDNGVSHHRSEIEGHQLFIADQGIFYHDLINCIESQQRSRINSFDLDLVLPGHEHGHGPGN